MNHYLDWLKVVSHFQPIIYNERNASPIFFWIPMNSGLTFPRKYISTYYESTKGTQVHSFFLAMRPWLTVVSANWG